MNVKGLEEGQILENFSTFWWEPENLNKLLGGMEKILFSTGFFTCNGKKGCLCLWCKLDVFSTR
jgi:hypothetical protein